jgi:hypothetical protein
MTMKDKHHGTWTTEENSLLKLKWFSVEGYASFKVTNVENNKFMMNCIECGWEFMKSWSMKFINTTPVSFQIEEEASSFVEKAWLAGKGWKDEDESYHENPWRFFSNGYFMTMRDEHHGVWNIKVDELSSKVILDLTWRSTEGNAQFEKVDSKNFKCSKWCWEFMKSWSII